MTLINPTPIGFIHQYRDKKGELQLEIEFPELKKPELCHNCHERMTTKTHMGFVQCPLCYFYQREACSLCKYGIPRSTYRISEDGNDLHDWVSQWTACGKRSYGVRDEGGMYCLTEFDHESHFSISNIPLREKEVCFEPKDPTFPQKKEILYDWLIKRDYKKKWQKRIRILITLPFLIFNCIWRQWKKMGRKIRRTIKTIINAIQYRLAHRICQKCGDEYYYFKDEMDDGCKSLCECCNELDIY